VIVTVRTPSSSSVPVNSPAVPPPAASAASSASRTKVRTLASGGRQRIDFLPSLNPDCTAAGYVTVRIITPPAHDELTTERGVDYTNYPKENQRYQCSLRRSLLINVYYKSTPGYFGADSALIEVLSPIASSIMYTINVK
jgi:hypothetical protein